MIASTAPALKRFLRHESAGGIILVSASVIAIILASSPMARYYKLLIETPVVIQIGALEIAKPLLLWVNDGLMAVFFFLVGLELKREFLAGELAEPRNLLLPGMGAIGGMVVPALFYLYFNYDDPVAVKGWAIPAATDIAFALGVLSLLGSRVPLSLKVFLTSLAIFDDVGAIAIIALFYTSHISLIALAVASGCMVILLVLNLRGTSSRSVYLLIGLFMWVALLKSGVHATLAGVLLAMFIPMGSGDEAKSPLLSLEHDLGPAVTFVILPIFAFCNSGIDVLALKIEQIFHGVPLGIALGLFLGKQIGVFLCCLACLKWKLASMPKGGTLMQLYGVSVLTGIGFTMSLFVGSLAFEETGVNLMFDERVGIIIGSLVSGILGYLVLRFASPRKREGEE